LSGNVTFKGTTNLDLGPATINIAGPTVTLNQNTLTTEGDLDGHNTGVLTVNGSGTWDITGAVSDNALSITINGATVLFDKAAGNAINGGSTTVNTNGTLVMAQVTGTQTTAAATLVLGGGTVDMKGDTEPVGVVTFNSGTLLNSAAGSSAALPDAAITLHGASCVFDVATADATLTVSNVNGTGGLVETGLGTLNLGTNSYSGNTTVSNGTLVVNSPTFATNSTVTICTNAAQGNNGVLNLNFPNGTNIVAGLIINGVSYAPGIYNANTDPLYLAGSGNIQVVPVSTTNPLPGPVQFTLSGSTLSLSWPTNLGWMLQSQTNSLSVGLTNSWVDISNSVTVTSTNITVNPTNPAVFFRLRHP